MARKNRTFGRLLDEGISSVARRQRKTMAIVEDELAAALGYSGHTVQHWRRGHIPTDLAHVAEVLRYCVRHGRVNRAWATSLLQQSAFPDANALLDELFPASDADSTALPRVFICYGRDRQPDETVVFKLARAFSATHHVFFDQARAADPGWVSRIRQELEQAAFVVILLSAAGVQSEVLAAEVEMAHTLASRADSKLRLLPVRLAFREPLPDPLHGYLQDRPAAFWQDEGDTPALLEAVSAAFQGAALPLDAAAQARLGQRPAAQAEPQPSAQRWTLEMPEGTMAPDSAFYVRRESDEVAQAAIARRGVTITIKGPRQVGKSSLLIRIMETAEARGEQVVYLDFQMFRSTLDDADAFFRLFCRLLSFQRGQADATEATWQLPLPNPFRVTDYVSRHLLPGIQGQLLLAMDEVDAVFGADFRTDFFAMLRSWHNNRAFEKLWQQLDLALVTSTEPYFFVDNLNQSPFNVGEVVELQPLSVEQVADLNRRHGEPLSGAEVGELYDLVQGHPYLTRRALYLVAAERYPAGELLARAADYDGPFGDHLRSLLLRLHEREPLLPSLREVLQAQTCSDQRAYFRLRGAGLVRRDNGHVWPANTLYARFLTAHLGE